MRRAIAALAVLAAGFLPPAATATTTPVTHIVLIMEENHSYSATVGHMPYLDSLATQYGLATNYWATNFPSLPNYQQLTSGVASPTKDCIPSSTCISKQPSIFGQLAGNWSVWAESMPKPCDKANTTLYAPRHTAGPYYTDISSICAAHDVALPATPTISSAFTLVAPNLNDDAHNGTLAQADTWLKAFVPKLLSQPTFTDGSTLIEITFDSGAPNCGAACPSHVETVFINPQLAKLSLAGKYTHDSLLRLNEELLGLPLLGGAKTAADIRPALGL